MLPRKTSGDTFFEMKTFNEHLTRKGKDYCERLERSDVDKILKGPKRVSEGMVKWDHLKGRQILHFTQDKYNDKWMDDDTFHIEESKSLAENNILRSFMAQFAQETSTEALCTLPYSRGAAVRFRVKVQPAQKTTGWVARLLKLEGAGKRKKPEKATIERYFASTPRSASDLTV